MNKLKQLFPHSFAADSVKGVLMALLYYVVINIIGTFVFGLLDGLPALGFAFKVLQGLLMIYVFAGISLAVLRYFGIIKP